jgi:hypothetical protein
MSKCYFRTKPTSMEATDLQFAKSLVTEWIPPSAIEVLLTYLYQIGPTNPRVLHEIQSSLLFTNSASSQ